MFYALAAKDNNNGEIVVDRFDRLSKTTRSVNLDSLLYKRVVKMQKIKTINKVIKLSKVVKADQKMSIFCVQPILPYILVGSFAEIDFASSRRIGSEMTSPSSLVGNLFGDSINHGSLIRESRSVIRALRSRMDGKSITPLPL